MATHPPRVEVPLLAALMFQSSPAPEGECNLAAVLPLFQSSPARVQPEVPCWPSVRRKMFQSSPAPEGECNLRSTSRLEVSIPLAPEGECSVHAGPYSLTGC